jgi:hypothetical protein
MTLGDFNNGITNKLIQNPNTISGLWASQSVLGYFSANDIYLLLTLWWWNAVYSTNQPKPYFLFPWLYSSGGPRPPHCWGFEITLSHTTLGRIDPSHRPSLPDNTQRSQETDVHPLDRIRTRNPSKSVPPQTHTLDRSANELGKPLTHTTG